MVGANRDQRLPSNINTLGDRVELSLCKVNRQPPPAPGALGQGAAGVATTGGGEGMAMAGAFMIVEATAEGTVEGVTIVEDTAEGMGVAAEESEVTA